MRRNLIGPLLTTALIAGLLFANASPTQATHGGPPHSVASFHPTDNGPMGPESGDQLSDRNDGTNSTAHLTAVATRDTQRVVWFQCLNTVYEPPGNQFTQAELNDDTKCGRIGTSDDTPRTPPSSSSGESDQSDEAYDTEWDIPAALDRQVRDILTTACTGAIADPIRIEPQGFPEVPPNCTFDIENNVSLDDAQTTTSGTPPAPSQPTDEQTSAAEITTYCTQDVQGGPGDQPNTQDANTRAEDPCEVSPLGSPSTPTTAEAQAVNSRFQAFPHGSPIPRDGFVFRATSDPSVAQGGGVLFWGITPGDAFSDAGFAFPSAVDPCKLIDPSPHLWECVVRADQIPANEDEYDLFVIEQGSLPPPDNTVVTAGAGFCDPNEPGETADPDSHDDPDADVGGDDTGGDDLGPCQLDAHYVTANQRGVGLTRASFQPGAQTTNQSPPANAGCDGNETPDRDETNEIGNTDPNNPSRELVAVCMTDTFGGAPVGEAITFESVGPSGSGIFGCSPDERTDPATVLPGSGTLHDHDGNGRFDHCHTVAGNSGEATALINNVSGTGVNAQPGDQTITACSDPETNLAAGAASQPANHGCATGVGGAPTAATSRDAVVKHWVNAPNHVHLVYQPASSVSDPCHSGVATKDLVAGQRDTLLACVFDTAHNPLSTTQAANVKLSWAHTSTLSGNDRAIQFDNPLPVETDANGRATASFLAVRPGTDSVTVFLVNDAGQSLCTTGDTRCQASITVRVSASPTPTQSPTQSATPTQTVTQTVTPTSTTTTDPAARTLTLASSTGRTRFGRQFTLTGAITGSDPVCHAGQTVTILRNILGTSSVVQAATATTNADGTFSTSLVADRSANYVAHVEPSPTCSEANSASVPVLVKVSVGISFSRNRVPRGTRVSIRATVAPCEEHAGTQVVLFQSIGGELAKVDTAQLNGSCGAAFNVRARRSTTYQVRWPKQDDDHVGGRSGRKILRVRR